MKVDFSTREGIMKEWDKWRHYIANGGRGSWPRDAFESLLDYLMEQEPRCSTCGGKRDENPYCSDSFHLAKGE